MDILSSQLGALTELIMSANVDTADIDCHRHHQPARDHHRVGHAPPASPVYERHRLAVPPHGAHVWTAIESDRALRPRSSANARACVPDAYFSATKITWMLDEVPGARERAEAGELLFGTVDSWLIWKLTGGAVHVTDVHQRLPHHALQHPQAALGSTDLLKLSDIPEAMLPEVRPSSGSLRHNGEHPGRVRACPSAASRATSRRRSSASAASMRARRRTPTAPAAFCSCTPGTRPCASEHGLVTTVAASAPNAGDTEYALEGSVFMAGALIQWLRDELGIIDSVAETDAIARSVATTDGVFVVPAFTGLGAPWWDADARGAILGLTRGAGRAHIVRAALESIAYQVCDLARAMAEDARMPLSVLNVDGGAAANDFLMQFQADMLGAPLRRPDNAETTALGAAYLAGLSTGFWKSTEELAALREGEDRFLPTFDEPMRAARLAAWHEAVSRVRS